LTAGHAPGKAAAPALEELCRTYWYPLYAHVRRSGYSAEDAEDLTQEFFLRLLARGWVRAADPGRGRFRSFLLASMNHFLSNQWHRARAEKRGGSRQHLSLETVDAEQLYSQEPSGHLNVEEAFDRAWALQLLRHVLEKLRADSSRFGNSVPYEVLKRFLPGAECPPSYAEAAAELHVPEGTLKCAVHRFKRHYGELLRDEISHTVASAEDVEPELRHFIAVVSK
jgi:RNA polymerase sigma-70 factor (ECF subfamily)